MCTARISLLVCSLLFFCMPVRLVADSTLLGYNTNGDVYQIDPATGGLTLKAGEEIHSFDLGAIARVKSTLFYLAAPAGVVENSLFTANTKTGSITHLDINRQDPDDDASMLFFDSRKLYGLFYNSSAGTLKLYHINLNTGVTTLRKDLSTLNVEPIAGSVARSGKFFYFLAKPSSDSARRQLVRFSINSKLVKVSEVQTKGSDKTPVLCDRLKRIGLTANFLCLASPTSTQVDAYRLQPSGVATFLTTLSNVERLAGGHTMLSPDGKSFYAFVYAPGESNNQRLIKLNAAGLIKSNVTVDTLIVGARFGAEEPDEE